MNTIRLPKKTDPGNEQTSSDGVQESINPFPPEVNITDGGEFLDDGIRMKEQPFGETTTKENE